MGVQRNKGDYLDASKLATETDFGGIVKRRAIIIEAANLKGQNPLPGAEVDLKNYQRYLCSIEGGYWYPAEITPLSKPSKKALLDEIRKAEREAEYLFIAFSGHGYTKRANPYAFPQPTVNQLTMLCINDTEEIALAEINPTIKNFIIADSCRTIEQVQKFADFAEALQASYRFTNTEQSARTIFDNAVINAEAGQIIAYSCGINESAGEDKNRGGYFSAAMMEFGLGQASRGFQRAISTAETFEQARLIVKSQAAQQNPEYSAGRRLRHFPFAVKV